MMNKVLKHGPKLPKELSISTFQNVKPLKHVTNVTNVTIRAVATPCWVAGQGPALPLPFVLSQHLIERDASCDGCVERVDIAAHGKLHEQVAMFPHQPANAFAFVADDQGYRSGQVGLHVQCLGLTRQSHHPDILLLEILDSAGEIGFLS